MFTGINNQQIYQMFTGTNNQQIYQMFSGKYKRALLCKTL
jgi:hypothetical protein